MSETTANEKIRISIKRIQTQLDFIKAYKKPISNLTDIVDLRNFFKLFRTDFRSFAPNSNEAKEMIKLAIENFPLFITEFERISNEHSKEIEEKVNCIRMIGDIKRYLIEFNEDTPEKSLFVQEALVTYRDAMDLCEKLPKDDLGLLSVYLNFSVLLADEMREIDEAISLIQGLKDSINLEEAYKSEEKKLVLEIIFDNLEYFKKNRELYFTEEKISN